MVRRYVGILLTFILLTTIPSSDFEELQPTAFNERDYVSDNEENSNAWNNADSEKTNPQAYSNSTSPKTNTNDPIEDRTVKGDTWLQQGLSTRWAGSNRGTKTHSYTKYNWAINGNRHVINDITLTERHIHSICNIHIHGQDNGHDCISDKGPTQLEEVGNSFIKDGIPTEYRPPPTKDGTTWTHTNYPGERQKSRVKRASWFQDNRQKNQPWHGFRHFRTNKRHGTAPGKARLPGRHGKAYGRQLSSQSSASHRGIGRNRKMPTAQSRFRSLGGTRNGKTSTSHSWVNSNKTSTIQPKTSGHVPVTPPPSPGSQNGNRNSKASSSRLSPRAHRRITHRHTKTTRPTAVNCKSDTKKRGWFFSSSSRRWPWFRRSRNDRTQAECSDGRAETAQPQPRSPAGRAKNKDSRSTTTKLKCKPGIQARLESKCRRRCRFSSRDKGGKSRFPSWGFGFFSKNSCNCVNGKHQSDCSANIEKPTQAVTSTQNPKEKISSKEHDQVNKQNGNKERAYSNTKKTKNAQSDKRTTNTGNAQSNKHVSTSRANGKGKGRWSSRICKPRIQAAIAARCHLSCRRPTSVFTRLHNVCNCVNGKHQNECPNNVEKPKQEVANPKEKKSSNAQDNSDANGRPKNNKNVNTNRRTNNYGDRQGKGKGRWSSKSRICEPRIQAAIAARCHLSCRRPKPASTGLLSFCNCVNGKHQNDCPTNIEKPKQEVANPKEKKSSSEANGRPPNNDNGNRGTNTNTNRRTSTNANQRTKTNGKTNDDKASPINLQPPTAKTSEKKRGTNITKNQHDKNKITSQKLKSKLTKETGINQNKDIGAKNVKDNKPTKSKATIMMNDKGIPNGGRLHQKAKIITDSLVSPATTAKKIEKNDAIDKQATISSIAKKNGDNGYTTPRGIGQASSDDPMLAEKPKSISNISARHDSGCSSARLKGKGGPKTGNSEEEDEEEKEEEYGRIRGVNTKRLSLTSCKKQEGPDEAPNEESNESPDDPDAEYEHGCISEKVQAQPEEVGNSFIKDGIPTEYRPPPPKDGTTWTHTNYPGERQKSRDEQQDVASPIPASFTWRQDEQQDVASPIPASFTWRQDEQQDVDSSVPSASFTWRQDEQQGTKFQTLALGPAP
ncbi:PREDICTED: uncharacterized protein DDB_G0287625-like [Branchiostoma belcheri]|uniref:Uncharacterized protein DDB_G0287625-like n=1 Tax=Branchiostoma belcheri TaxID=7741 RepID=A0A6P4YUE7_BRABE|nr:PREDICTED: uncharacterized protein DDB_G0287625-like [Branchiostoma belcheri]